MEEQLSMLPCLRSRVVIGWWLGSKAQFEELLALLKEEVGTGIGVRVEPREGSGWQEEARL